MLDLRNGDAASFEHRALESNILLTLTHVLGDQRRGFRSASRIATHEITRQGMRESDMKLVAGFMRRATDGAPALEVRADIEEFLESFQVLHYSFDGS